MLTLLNPTAGSTDRVLDGPTNLVWIDPWLAYLEFRGVRYIKGAQIEEFSARTDELLAWCRPARQANRLDRRLLRGGVADRAVRAIGGSRHACERPERSPTCARWPLMWSG